MEDKTRFKVIVSGRRFGKTTVAINKLLHEALLKKGQYWYVAPTYRQAKEIAWRMLLDRYFALPLPLQRGKHEQELWIEVGNGSRISLKGADNEDSLRGSGLDGIIVDEVASVRNWNYLWDEALSPSLLDKRGWAWFIGTPKGYNHFYELFNRQQKDKEYKSFRFTSYDNPFISSAELDKERERKSEDVFAQEYLADFRKHTGLVHKEFDRKLHVIEPIVLPNVWRFYRTMDFGAVNPTVCLWIAVDNSDNIYVYDEYYHSSQTSKFHAETILAKTKDNIITTWGDPSAKQEMLDYAMNGLVITPALRVFNSEGEWVNSGIEKVREALKPHPQTGRPRLFIFSNCINTIREFESYRWMETKGGELLKETVEKTDDHCMDALRYFVVSNPQEKKDDFPRYEPEQEFNTFTGYHIGQ